MLLAIGYPYGISGTDLQSSSANTSSFTSVGPAGSRGSVAVSLSCVVSSVSSACAGSPATSPAPWAHSAQRSLQLSQAYRPKRPAVASPRYPIGRCAYLLQSCGESINPLSASLQPLFLSHPPTTSLWQRYLPCPLSLSTLIQSATSPTEALVGFLPICGVPNFSALRRPLRGDPLAYRGSPLAT